MAAEGIGERLTAKVGPLPVWGWAVLLLVAFFAYQHFHRSSGGTASAGTTGADPNAANPVPGFDSASEVGGGGSGFGTPSPDTITNNYYYGTTAAGQATGGGTSNGVTSPNAPVPSSSPTAPRQLDVTLPSNLSSDFVTSPGRTSGDLAAGGVPSRLTSGGSLVTPTRASSGFRPSSPAKTPSGGLGYTSSPTRTSGGFIPSTKVV